jgi:transposase InsO family protein
LRSHWSVLAAADFFTVDVWTGSQLTRFAVLFVMDLSRRRVEIAGTGSEPTGAWVVQCGRQVSDPVEGSLVGKRNLLHNRDPLFTDAFRETLSAAGVQTVRPAPHSPNLNAFAERFVRPSKNVSRSADPHHRRFAASRHSRVHDALSSLAKSPRDGESAALPTAAEGRNGSPIACRPRLGGLLKYYHRPAA